MTSNAMAHELPPHHLTVDLLRIACAYGIVCFHWRLGSGSVREVFYAGLVCFIIMSVWFCMVRNNRCARHAGMLRILIPWLFWSAVFVVKDYALGSPLPPNLDLPLRLWAGTALHLWYLMFLVTVLTAIWWLRSRIWRSAFERPAWAGTILLALTADSWRAGH